MIWILPANESCYDHFGSFKKNGMVDWAQQARYKIGDIVYLYLTAPASIVAFKLVVAQVNIPFEKAINDSEFWRKPALFEKRKKAYFTRLVPLPEKPKTKISMAILHEFGVKGQIQRARRIGNNKKLLIFLDEAFDSNLPIDYPDEAIQGSYPEGAVIKVFVNKYERNPDARSACIALKGCRCSICGFDFEKVYGQLGSRFIHVHHIVPLNQIGKGYEVDPSKDLIPVCPNCHAMLHRKKADGTYPTVDELKSLFRAK